MESSEPVVGSARWMTAEAVDVEASTPEAGSSFTLVFALRVDRVPLLFIQVRSFQRKLLSNYRKAANV